MAMLAVCLATILASISGAFGEQPENLGDLKTVIKNYINSGAYETDLAAADQRAGLYIDAHSDLSIRPAVVLDIDETSLSNLAEIEADDFGFIRLGECSHLPDGPCGSLEWDALSSAPAIKPTLALFNVVKARGIAVFFVTGRHEFERGVTEKALHNAGYDGWKGLLLEPDDAHPKSVADFKSKARAQIEALGYHIIATIGDQPSDLAGGHADQGFLLPNPFYRLP
jgi:acid phosphatase